MGYENLRDQSIEQMLERVEGLQAVASQGQVQSVMALLAKCTIEIGESLRKTSMEIRQASDQIRNTSTEIHQFNESTTKLTNQMIRLNRILTWATVIIALGTLAAAVASFITVFKK